MTWTCPACEKTVDPLRAGSVAVFDDRFEYFCDRLCREKYTGASAREGPARPGGDSAQKKLALHGQREREDVEQPIPAGQDKASSARGAATRGAATRGAATRGAATRGAATRGAATRPTLPSSKAVAHAPDPVPSSVPPVPSERPPNSVMPFWAALASAARPQPIRSSDEAFAPSISSAAAAALARGAAVGGVLCVCLGLAGNAPAVQYTRIALALFSEIALAVRVVRLRSDPLWPHPLLLLLGGLCPFVIAFMGLHDPSLDDAIVFAGAVVIARALAMHVADRLLAPVATARSRVAAALDRPVRRTVEGGQEEVVASYQIRAGDELLVVPGDVLAADGVVAFGDMSISPWPDAAESIRRREGEPVVAGAQVITGRARVRVSHAGNDRVWARMMLDSRRRPDIRAKLSRFGRNIAALGGGSAMLLSGLAAYMNGERPIIAAMIAMGALGIVSNAVVAVIAPTHIGRGVLSALRRGISYRSAADWDRAGEVSIAAFCARSTLLIGEPELADLVAVGRLNEDTVLALAAGAESASSTPEAAAIERASIQRRIRPDAVRSPTLQPGLGITAIASTGDSLCVGSRALMLKERISVATAEQTIAEIEAHGRQVLLVALGGKLVGVIGLQDGLRPGARAAVQQVLDAQVEPVLLSGDTRETCEAIGRALDIEHLRPEIPAVDRAHEVERLAQGGLTVAVLGSPREDEPALAAAQVAVALGSAGIGPGDWGIALASNDVRDGALGIALARRTRLEARTGLSLALAPGVLTTLAVAFGLLPALCAPIASCASTIAAALHARSADPCRAGSRATGHETT